MNLSMGLFIVLIGVVAIIIVSVLFSMMVLGAIRIGIFHLIGVLDQIRNQGDFFNAVLGTVSISTTPKGHVQSVMLEGHALI